MQKKLLTLKRTIYCMIEYQKYLEIDPSKRFGQPIIIGTRITVFDVLNWMANGMDIDNIILDFPELSRTQIQACLAYAADRQHKLRVAS